MTKSIEKRKSPMATLRDLIVSQRSQIEMALPKHLSTDRLIRVTMTALRHNPKLLECTQASVLGSVIQAAQLGLETDGALGHAHLVPFKKECQLIVGYRGMIDLARRSGQIQSISAHVVYENDTFGYAYGLEEKLEHAPTLGKRGEPVAVYAVARLLGGGYQFEVLTMEQIAEAAKMSKSRRDDRPWATHWEEMARKTAIRRLFKYLPVSVELQKAVGLDDMAESGVSQGLEAIVIDEDPPPPQKALDGVKNRLLEKQTKSPKPKPEPEPKTETQADPGDAQPLGNSEQFEPQPTQDFDVYNELDSLLKELYGDKAGEKLALMAKKAGFKSAALTKQQAGMLLDILNNEAGGAQ